MRTKTQTQMSTGWPERSAEMRRFMGRALGRVEPAREGGRVRAHTIK